MKNRSFLIFALLLSAASPRAKAATAGQFDSYIFTMSWEPAFCEGKPSATECQSEDPARFDATNLALHGLWPDVNGDSRHAYGFCGDDAAAAQSLDRAATWCQMPEPTLSDATLANLTKVMPGVASCLDHHEWNKHGSCTGMSDDDYFALAASLVQQVSATNFGRFLSAHAGQTVNAEDALTAFEQDFGAGSRSLVVMNCANVRGSQALLEVQLRLPASLAPGATLSPSLLMTVGGSGSCPSSFLLDPVPSR